MEGKEFCQPICCYDNSSNALATAIALLNRRDEHPLAEAALMGNMGNQQWNNPFAYLIWMMFAQRFMGGWNDFNGQGQQNVETQNQLQAIRTQLQDNQNADCIKGAISGVDQNVRELAQLLNTDYNSLKDCCCDVRSGIARFGDQMGYRAEQVIAAMERGNRDILAAVQNCCCETQKELLQMKGDIALQMCQQTNTLQNGQRDLGQAITQGFAQVGYQQAQDKCEIIRAGEVNTQRIMDLLNGHWRDEQAREIQDLKAENSQLKQTQTILNAFRNGGCGCGCGCNNGCGC